MIEPYLPLKPKMAVAYLFISCYSFRICYFFKNTSYIFAIVLYQFKYIMQIV